MTSKTRSHFTYPYVASTIALVVALGTGGAYAANTVFSTDIVDGQVKTVDLANGAVAVAKLADGAITGEKLKDGTVQSKDVLDNNLKGVDIDESTLTNIGGGGPAGGDLTGTYPDPEIGINTVGGDELAGIRIFEHEEATLSDTVGGGPTERVLFEPFGNRRLTAVCEETAGGAVTATITFETTGALGLTSDVDSTAQNGVDGVTNINNDVPVPLVRVGATAFRATAAGSYTAFTTLAPGGGTAALTGQVAAATHTPLDDCAFDATGTVD